MERFCVQRKKERKLRKNKYGSVGRSNHLRDFDQNSMWAVMVDVITYEIGLFDDCRLRGVGLMRGVILPSPIDLRCRPYNTTVSRESTATTVATCQIACESETQCIKSIGFDVIEANCCETRSIARPLYKYQLIPFSVKQ